MINLRLGWLYEEKGQDERAWSRYPAGRHHRGGRSRRAGRPETAGGQEGGEGRPTTWTNWKSCSRDASPRTSRPARTNPLREKSQPAGCWPSSSRARTPSRARLPSWPLKRFPITSRTVRWWSLVHHLHAPRPSALACPAATARAQPAQHPDRTGRGAGWPAPGSPRGRAAGQGRARVSKGAPRSRGPAARPHALGVDCRGTPAQEPDCIDRSRAGTRSRKPAGSGSTSARRTMLLPSESKMVLHTLRDPGGCGPGRGGCFRTLRANG